MTRAGELATPASPLALRFLTLARSRLRVLRDEVRAGSADLTRIGLVGVALALQTVATSSPGHFRATTIGFFAGAVPLCTLLSLAVALVATLSLKPLVSLRTRKALAAGGLVVVSVLAVVGLQKASDSLYRMAQGTPYTNDGAALDLYAAEQVSHLHNPYLKTNIVGALAAINAPARTTTPLMDGQFRGAAAYPSDATIERVFLNVQRHRPHSIPPEFESKYDYPSGSFLLILPFVLLGIHDMHFLYGLAIVGIGIYLWKRLPRLLRPLTPALLLADVPLMRAAGSGQPDPLYALFLLVGYGEWSSAWLSPLAMGLAIGTKQLAWFFVPFYLLLVTRCLGWRQAVRRSSLMLLVFLVLNGPFIAWSPSAYLSGIAVPMTAPLFPLGMGIIALFISNLLPMLPKLVFSVAEAIAWIASTFAFARLRGLTAASGVVLAAFPLFFAWRSLDNYFYIVPLLALGVMFTQREMTGSLPAQPTSEPIAA